MNSKWKEDAEGAVAGLARAGEASETGADETRARDAGSANPRGGCSYHDDPTRFCIQLSAFNPSIKRDIKSLFKLVLLCER